MEIKGNYVKVYDERDNKRGYVILGNEDRDLTIDAMLRNMGLDPELTYYRFVEERPEGMPLERKDAWRDIKTFGDVVKACERNRLLFGEYKEADGSESYFPRLAYEMVKYAIDGGRGFKGYGFVPQLAITMEGNCPSEDKETYPLAGRFLKNGVPYAVFQVMPTINSVSPAIDTYLMNTVNPFGTYDWLAFSSIDKAAHVSAYFAKELLAVLYGDVDYEWEEA